MAEVVSLKKNWQITTWNQRFFDPELPANTKNQIMQCLRNVTYEQMGFKKIIVIKKTLQNEYKTLHFIF